MLTVGDGIATISGLEDAEYGEILLFECGIKGMILDLKEDEIGCVIFGDESEITEGSMVRRTRKSLAYRSARRSWDASSTHWASRSTARVR